LLRLREVRDEEPTRPLSQVAVVVNCRIDLWDQGAVSPR